MKKVLVTGGQGFVGSYLCQELVNNGYQVVSIDNFSKYGPIDRPQDKHPNFKLLEMDVRDLDSSIPDCLLDVDYIVACAAMIGGISYFHKYAYDLLATNERIMASTFDLALKLFKENALKRIIVLSSSMVFENTEIYPTPENEVKNCPPPDSTYGFQKLACEYFCKGAYEQYKLPYTIVRPFNCVGVGEDKALGAIAVKSGNIELMMSHVLPDIINKILKGQYPLEVLGEGNQVRCYTNGKDIARGIRLCVENEAAVNEDFNISIAESTSVLELAKLVWSVLYPNTEFKYISKEAYQYDVQKRIPDTTKAEKLLGFKAEIKLIDSIYEVLNYCENQK